MPSRNPQRSTALRLLICLIALACSDDSAVAPASTGEIKVTVVMTGSDLPGQYSVSAGGRSLTGSRSAAFAVIFGLAPGEHEVRLDVASNCQVLGDNPQTTTVTRGRTTSVSFAVTCSSVRGTLLFVTSTSGVDPDRNGYEVIVEGATVHGSSYYRRILLNATGEFKLEDAPAGDNRLTLVGLAVNCNAAGANPRTVPVRTAQTSTVAYEVSCAEATDQIAYVYEEATRSDLRLVNGDGSVIRSITSDVYLDLDPAWSPDGEHLAFATTRDGNREIYRIDPDGSNAVRLTDHPNDDFEPAWSPDGRRIAFTSSRSGNDDIFVMNADGTDVVQLTTSPFRDVSPAWSRDGRTIAFVSERDGRAEVYAMDATGAAQTRFTLGGGRQPVWSPDGTTLAFTVPLCRGYGCYPSIFIQKGTQAPTLLSQNVAERPSWSPDARRMVVDWYICDFYFFGCERDGIYIMMVDGTDVFHLARGHSAVWRPR